MSDNVSDKDVSERLGLSRDELRTWRTKCGDNPLLTFRELSGKPEKLRKWLWTPAGISWLTDQLNLESNQITKEINEKEEETNEQEVSVTRCNFPNTRLLQVKNKEGQVFTAICKDNRGFRVNLRITIKKDRHGWYVKRNPVYKGK